MTIETPNRIAFLRKSHLFRGLRDDQLAQVAAAMEEKEYSKGQKIIKEGDGGDEFYMIYNGTVRVIRQDRQKEKFLAQLVTNDYFGEEALLRHHHRTATVTSDEEQTRLLCLTRDAFNLLLKNMPRLRPNLEVSISSRRISRQNRFSWLEDGESIYFIDRRHMLVMWQMIILPLLVMLVPLVICFFYLFDPTLSYLLWIALGFFGIDLIWLIWRWIDWSNDYYIVTNRRIILLEKVAFLYDYRQEAPLSAILSINTETDVSGRLFGYGNIIVRTFVGNITFEKVGHPNEVEMFVREHWERTKDVSKRVSAEAIKLALRQKLGLASHPVEAPAVQVLLPYRPNRLRMLTSNLFKLRFESGNTVTYRKHWFVLVSQIWKPILSFILAIFLTWISYNNLNILMQEVEMVIMGIVLLFTAGWGLYQYIDWSNDIFQVTEDQIMDLDRKPFGKLEKQVAPLESILSTEARREGLMAVLFNYGHVFISVGGAKMVFEDVDNPSAVQQDIDRRRVGRRDKQERDRANVERERLVEWFAMYHESSREIRQEQEVQKNDQEKEKDKAQDDKVQ